MAFRDNGSRLWSFFEREKKKNPKKTTNTHLKQVLGCLGRSPGLWWFVGSSWGQVVRSDWGRVVRSGLGAGCEVRDGGRAEVFRGCFVQVTFDYDHLHPTDETHTSQGKTV